MASISSANAARGRKPLSIDLPLVPFLDLLLCCVMFLLVTAQWNRLAQLNATQHVPGSALDETRDSPLAVTLAVLAGGYELSSDIGERTFIAGRDVGALRNALAARLALDREQRRPLIMTAEDGVPYRDLIDCMDVARGAGYEQLQVDGQLR